MPTFINPQYVHVETGGSGGSGGGGGLVAAAVVVVAVGAAAVWVVREVLKIWVELAVIAGGTTVVMGSWLVWMAIKFNRGSLQVNQEAKAEAIASARAARALPAGEVHHHTHYEDHTHHHYDERQLHVHGITDAIAGRRAGEAADIPGEVIGPDREAIEARKAQPWLSVAGDQNDIRVTRRPGDRKALRGTQGRATEEQE